jgi:uncharacterized membrane protein YdbT with pleckstrin-like domain
LGKYIDNNLAEDEEIIVRAETTWLSQFWLLLIGGIILLLALSGKSLFSFIISLIFFGIAAINVLTTELALTNRRVIAKWGFVSRSTIELNNQRIESLNVKQSVLGRIFGFGSVVIGGVGGSHAPIPNIKAPLEFRKTVNNHLDSLQEANKQSNQL